MVAKASCPYFLDLLIGGNAPIAHLMANVLYLLPVRHKCGGKDIHERGTGRFLPSSATSAASRHFDVWYSLTFVPSVVSWAAS